MKILYIFLLIIFCGCDNTDMQTINLLNQRINSLEKESKASPRTLEQPKNNGNGLNRLNDAQKDFIEQILNYLADEEEPN